MLPNPCLLVLTDRSRLSPNWALAQAVAPAITGGCNLVVMRESDLPPTPRAAVARFVQGGIKGRVQFLTSGDPGFAISIGADGVLLECVETSLADARSIVGPDRLLGVAARNGEDAKRADSEGADFVLIEYDWTHPERVLQHFEVL